MKLTFGNWPLYYPDNDGEFVRHVNEHLSGWFEPVPLGASRQRKISDACCVPLKPLHGPNWRPEPKLKLYEMFMPAGFTRYGKIYVLMDAQAARRASQGIPSGEGASPSSDGYLKFAWEMVFFSNALEMQRLNGQPYYGADTALIQGSIDMRVSRATKIGSDIFPQLAASQAIYLVELVDRRYDVQFTTMPDFSGTSWSQLNSIIATTLKLPDVTANDLGAITIWGQPDKKYLNRPHENAGVVAEAVLWSFGFVYEPQISNTSKSPFLITGDSGIETVGAVPAEYGISFYKKIRGKLRCDLEPYLLLTPGVEDASKVPIIYSSMSARFSSESQATPSNITAIQNFSASLDALWQNITPAALDRTNTNFHAARFSKYERLSDYCLIDFNMTAGGNSWQNVGKMAVQGPIHSYAVECQETFECDEIIRFQLIEFLPACGDAYAFELSNENPSENCSGSSSSSFFGYESECLTGCPCEATRLIKVQDTCGLATLVRSQINPEAPNFPQIKFAPPQSMGFARKLYCTTSQTEIWEIISIGEGCCCDLPPPSSSGSSSSGSSSGSSSSGSSSGSGSSSSSSSSLPDSCVVIVETDVKCEFGVLNVYKRLVTICFTGSGLSKTTGAWYLDHVAGCCDCPPSSSSSSGSLGSSSSSGGSLSFSSSSGSTSNPGSLPEGPT